LWNNPNCTPKLGEKSLENGGKALEKHRNTWIVWAKNLPKLSFLEVETLAPKNQPKSDGIKYKAISPANFDAITITI
jgi:hypothetical protein